MLSTAKQRIESWSRSSTFQETIALCNSNFVLGAIMVTLENEKIYVVLSYQWQAIYYSQNAGNKNHIVNALSKASDFYQKQMLLKLISGIKWLYSNAIEYGADE
ncbi:hypothetical protein THIOSC15_150032 [uncultured Thiomicrorhabdus sp.]